MPKLWDPNPDINETIDYHTVELRQLCAAGRYRSAWRHAYVLVTILYYRAAQEILENENRGPGPIRMEPQ